MAVQDFEGTRVDEISDGIFRISTAVASIAGGGITYNQYLLVDDEPLLFHTGKRRMFSQVQEAVAQVFAAGTPALDLFLAFRGRRVRCAQSVPRRRSARNPPMWSASGYAFG